MKKIYIACLFLFFIHLVLNSQVTNEWVNLTPGLEVRCIAKEGNILWIGTSGGLVKFDTQTHQKKIFNKANSGLPDIYINDVCIDSNGGKWIAMEHGGVAYYDNQSWSVFNNYNSTLPQNFIKDISIDNFNNVWIAAPNKIYRYINGSFVLYAPAPAIQNFYAFERIHFDQNNTMWVCTYDRIFRIVSSSNITSFSSNDFGLPSFNLTDFDIDGNNTLWISSNYGLVKFDGVNHELFNSANSPLPCDVIASVEVVENEVILSTDCGLATYHNQNWTQYDTINSEITTNNLTCATKGNDNHFWIGSSENGLIGFSGSGWQNFSTSNSVLRHSNIFNMVIDKTGVKWFATFEGLVSLDGDYWTLYNTNNSPLPHNNVRDVVVDDQNNKFIATENGFAKFNNVVWTVYNTLNTSLPSNNINKLHISEDGYIWLGLEDKGLVRYDGQHWINFNVSNSGVPNNRISAINSTDSLIWIGTSSGLTKLKHFNWTTYNQSNSDLHSNSVMSITKGLNGNLLIGTLHGPTVFNDGNFSLLDSTSLLLNGSTVYSIDFDTDSSMLICTGNGLFIYKDTLVKHFHFFNAPLTSFNVSRAVRDSDGNLWLPTICGGIDVYNENGVVLSHKRPEAPEKSSSDVILFQNYPNPFSNATTITFDLPEPAYTTLQIFDVHGKLISQPIANNLTKGFHSIIFLSESLPDGVCFYTLKTNKFSVTKKMLLMKQY